MCVKVGAGRGRGLITDPWLAKNSRVLGLLLHFKCWEGCVPPCPALSKVLRMCFF